MPNDLIPQRPVTAGLPLQPSRPLADLVAMFMNGLEGPPGEEKLIRLPTQGERAMLEGRLKELRKLLMPIQDSMAAKERAAAAIAAMLSGSTFIQRLSDREAQEMVATYLAELREYPIFAIEAACNEIRHGRVPDAVQRDPTTRLVVKLAAEMQERQRAEGNRIVKIMNAGRIDGPPSEAQRKKIGAKMQKLGDVLKTSPMDEQDAIIHRAAEQRAVDRRERAILAEYRHLGIEPQYGAFGIIAPATLRTLGRLPEQQPTKKEQRR